MRTLPKRFDTEEDCIAFLAGIRWPHGVCCLKCKGEKISRFQAKGKTGKIRHLYQCASCHYQFSVTTGTIFHDSHLPLQRWFQAIPLVCETKEEVSANQLSQVLGIQYRTACHLVARIREVMNEESQEELGGTGRPETWEKLAFRVLLERREDIYGDKEAEPTTDPRKVLPQSARESRRDRPDDDADRGLVSFFRKGVTSPLSLAVMPISAMRYFPGYLGDLAKLFGVSLFKGMQQASRVVLPGSSR
jgi:transposase-like protein